MNKYEIVTVLVNISVVWVLSIWIEYSPMSFGVLDIDILRSEGWVG